MDRLGSMRVFVKVAEQGSFTRAGDALEMSNAVVTRHVADLEQHLGARLLNRTTRSLSLTEIGQAYLVRARHILQDVADADAIAGCLSQRPTGTLRIYAHPGFGESHLARLLPAYAREYPDVTLDVTLQTRSVDLVDEGYDIGIFIDFQKFDAGMIARQLAVAEVMLCASPEYVRLHGAPQTPEQVSDHVCLNFSYDQLRDFWPIREGDSPGVHNAAVNVPIKSKMFSNSGDLLRQCALGGMGVVLRTSFNVGDDFSSGRLLRLLPRHHLGQLSVTMVYPSRHLLSAKIRSFVEFMNAHFPHPETDPWHGKAE